jgi:hypothetical protein
MKKQQTEIFAHKLLVWKGRLKTAHRTTSRCLSCNGNVERLADLTLLDDVDWGQWMRSLHQMSM